MLYLYTNADQTLAVGGQLAFQNVGASTTSSIKQTSENIISITSPGIYEVSFNGDVANNTVTSGEVGIQLYVNGTIYNGAEASATSSSLTDVQNISFNALLRVKPNCCVINDNLPAALTFINTGLAAVCANAAVVIKKVR